MPLGATVDDGGVNFALFSEEATGVELLLFDSHNDANPVAIDAAYQLAKTKYDPDVVSHLGDEAQAHFKAKAQAVELAYQILSAGK